ncbi:MAG: alpha/beta hydrolase [Gammaproteobacteria bacterium]|nr:alpha/beta hydrolase [Gammaproteobacteria bacterium]
MSEALSIPVDVGDVGLVSALFDAPAESRALIVLGHGAGAGMNHGHMASITAALNERGVAVLRFHFPYMELGKNRTDRVEVCSAVYAAVAEAGRTRARGKPLLLGGHSFGGRMASHAVLEPSLSDVAGLVFFSFPLHMPGKPSIKRAAHLPDVTQPMLFLSGTRDKMAEEDQLAAALESVGDATVHRLFTGDHSFKILKRTRKDAEDIYVEAARVAAEWLDAKGI